MPGKGTDIVRVTEHHSNEASYSQVFQESVETK